MIMIRLMGGLGNQLFQYAAGRQLAHRLKAKYYLETSWFDEVHVSDTKRSFELGIFDIKANIAGPRLLEEFGGTDFSMMGKWRTNMVSGWKFSKKKFYGYGYDKSFTRVKDNTYVKGFFQSEKYFSGIQADIRKELSFHPGDGYGDHPLFKIIRESVSVSMHVRRGDYVKNSVHTLCSKEYYEKAIALLENELGNTMSLFIFSDDQEWARQHFTYPNAVFVDNKGTGLAHIDLFLMSNCKHHIIANSTYSWWAAWMNPSEEKIVLAPEWWTSDHKTADIDLLFHGMKLVG